MLWLIGVYVRVFYLVYAGTCDARGSVYESNAAHTNPLSLTVPTSKWCLYNEGY